MLRKIELLAAIIFLFSFTATSQNCPDYSNTSAGSGEACGGQNYTMTVPNTGCNGEVYFDVVGNYGTFGSEITWEVVSSQSGATVASGGPGTNGAPINITVGPLDPNIHGNVFNLIVYDSWGDGFSGGGFIQTEQGGTVLVYIDGNFGSQTNSLFNANIIISSATITINTPSGNVVETVSNCNDFITQMTLNNANFCNAINVELPWTITCDVSGATLASGNHSVTVYPEVPSDESDLVDISWNTSTCSWDVEAQNDCDALDIGTVFNISPDPSGLPIDACANGNQDFTIDYLGLSGSPDCCATAGPVVPITYVDSQSAGEASVEDSPFGGTNNSAYFNIPPNGDGGSATSLTLNINMTDYCYPDVPGLNNDSYWVTIYVDGNVIYDQMFTPPPNDFNTTIDLTDIPGGYDQNSDIDVYVYPNTFFDGGINTTFVPGTPCGSLGVGEWSAGAFDVTLDVTFEQTAGSPVDCSFDIAEPQACCGSTNLSASNPANDTVQCSGDVPPADPAVVDDATSDCSTPPTVTFVSETSDNNVCNGEQITRTYEVEDACGNTIQVTHTIVIDSYTPTFTIVGTDPTVCGGTDGYITVSGLDPNTSYEIGYNGNATQTITTDVNGEYEITGLGAGSYTDFTIAPSSCSSCEGSDSNVISLEDPNSPTVDAGADQEVCEGTEITLTGSGTATSFSWDNGVSDGIGFNQPVGTVTYTVTGTDASGCENTDQVEVTVLAEPTVDAGADIEECEGTEITLTGSGTAASYTWDNGVSDGVGFTQPSGTVTYTVTGTTASCSATDQVDVTINPNPTVDAGADQGICAGDDVTLSGSGADFYTWNNGVDDGVSFTPGSTTTYTVTGEITASGCTATDEVTITVNPLPTVGAGSDQTICEGEQVTLTGTGADSYSWDNGVVNGDPFTPSSTTTYTVTGTDVNGCENTATVTITLTPQPSAEFTATPNAGQAPLEVDFTNNSSNGSSYDWDFGNGQSESTATATDQYMTYVNPGSFEVWLTVTNGTCSDQMNLLIIVEDLPLSYNIPNVFTPNEDGSNDLLHMSLENAASFEMEIFNRWGNLVGVVNSTDPEDGWNGRNMNTGEEVADGVYFYTYKIVDLNGEEIEGHQYVHLQR